MESGDAGKENSRCCNRNVHIFLQSVALVMMVLATGVQAYAVAHETNWDVYYAVPGKTYTDVISARQTLYQLFVDKDLPKAHFVPPAYPYTAYSRNTGWKSPVLTLETISIALAGGSVFIMENSLLFQIFLQPNSKISRIFQFVLLFLGLATSIGSGVLSLSGAQVYKLNYKKTLSRYAQQAPTYYETDKNTLANGYYAALIGAGMILFSAFLQLICVMMYVLCVRPSMKANRTEVKPFK